MTLRVGLIDYINIFPITHALEERGSLPFVTGTPSELNHLLADGDLDTSPISSIEYARHQGEYRLLPDISISSRGKVRSVILFSRVPLERLNGETVGICRATATSRILLRILLEDHVKVSPSYAEDATTDEARRGTYPAILLIGDEALGFRRAARHDPRLAAYAEHDLGEMWFDRTGLPMVFSVWAVRRDAANHREVSRLHDELRASREQGSLLPPTLLARAAARTGLSTDELRDYYARLHYTLGAEEERALLSFYARAAAKGLCPPCGRLGYALPHLAPAAAPGAATP